MILVILNFIDTMDKLNFAIFIHYHWNLKMIFEASTIGKVGENTFGNSNAKSNNIVTDLREPINVVKHIGIKKFDITITTTKNNVVGCKHTNSKINSKPYNPFLLGKIKRKCLIN